MDCVAANAPYRRPRSAWAHRVADLAPRGGSPAAVSVDRTSSSPFQLNSVIAGTRRLEIEAIRNHTLDRGPLDRDRALRISAARERN